MIFEIHFTMRNIKQDLKYNKLCLIVMVTDIKIKVQETATKCHLTSVLLLCDLPDFYHRKECKFTAFSK